MCCPRFKITVRDPKHCSPGHEHEVIEDRLRNTLNWNDALVHFVKAGPFSMLGCLSELVTIRDEFLEIRP